jgi:hypothetical protein
LKGINNSLNERNVSLITENTLLKAKISSLELNEELLNDYKGRKEQFEKEIEILRRNNRNLKEIIDNNSQKSNEDQSSLLFHDDIENIKRRVDRVCSKTFETFENVNGSYIDLC